jgi:hypothetical protein
MLIFDTEFFGKTHEILTNNYFIGIPRLGPLRVIDISTPNFKEININYNPGFISNTQDVDVDIDARLAVFAHTGSNSKLNVIPAIGAVIAEITEPVTACAFHRSDSKLFIGSTNGARLVSYDVSQNTITTVATSPIANIQRAKYVITDGVTRLFVISDSTNLLYELDPDDLSIIHSIAANTADAGSIEFDLNHDGTRIGYLNSRNTIIRDISDPSANWTASAATILNTRLLSYPQSFSFIRGTTDFLTGGFRTTTLPAIRRHDISGSTIWTLSLSPNNKTRNTTTVRRLRSDQTGQYFSYSVNSSSTENDIRNFEIRSTSDSSLLFATFPTTTENNSIACGFSFSSELV